MQQLTDLREILRYVPHFRDKVFVISLDGAIVADDNFANLLLDIAVLRRIAVRFPKVAKILDQLPFAWGKRGRAYRYVRLPLLPTFQKERIEEVPI